MIIWIRIGTFQKQDTYLMRLPENCPTHGTKHVEAIN
jgi:hypothetical protein